METSDPFIDDFNCVRVSELSLGIRRTVFIFHSLAARKTDFYLALKKINAMCVNSKVD